MPALILVVAGTIAVFVAITIANKTPDTSFTVAGIGFGLILSGFLVVCVDTLV